MKVKLFGDTQAIPWNELGVKMPFAPMHELAQKYVLEHLPFKYCPNIGQIHPVIDLGPILRTFELKTISVPKAFTLRERIVYRAGNTVAALDQCTPDTICINLGGGYHHGKQHPVSGYAYSLINDIVWAVDYQLEERGIRTGIIDLDFHFGGGTVEYYQGSDVLIYDRHNPKGVLHKHVAVHEEYMKNVPSIMNVIKNSDKILLNLGTDCLLTDPLFGDLGRMLTPELFVMWTSIIQKIIKHKKPLAITFGGGYGVSGLGLYVYLIQWTQSL